MSQKIFVCGATGTQGGATARQLLESGVIVHALARNPSSPNAKALEALGIKLWPGSYDDGDALTAAISGTSAVFMNFMPDLADMGSNLRHARSILRIAKDAGTVHQVVYSSSIGTDEALKSALVQPGSMLSQVMQSKADIEQAVRDAALGSWTILRPCNLMANYVDPLAAMQVMGLADTGRWTTANLASDRIPLVDTLTVGRFSAAALLEPARFHGHVITYADEILNMGDGIISKLARVTGRDLQMVTIGEEELEAQKATNPFIGGQLFMREMHNYVDMEEVNKWGIAASSFDRFLEREKRAVEETYLSSRK